MVFSCPSIQQINLFNLFIDFNQFQLHNATFTINSTASKLNNDNIEQKSKGFMLKVLYTQPYNIAHMIEHDHMPINKFDQQMSYCNVLE